MSESRTEAFEGMRWPQVGASLRILAGCSAWLARSGSRGSVRTVRSQGLVVLRGLMARADGAPNSFRVIIPRVRFQTPRRSRRDLEFRSFPSHLKNPKFLRIIAESDGRREDIVIAKFVKKRLMSVSMARFVSFETIFL